jgi:Methylamine utilisation protein MauE
VELIGLYLVAGILLVVAGVAKAVRPDDVSRAVAAALRLDPDRLRGAVRILAAGEAVLGAAALAWPAPVPAALVATSYLGFAVLLTVVRSKGGALASCGCFGRPDTPVTVTHVVADLCLGAAAVAVAAAGRGSSVLGLLAGQPGRGFPLVATSLLAAGLSVLVMDQLSRLVAIRREVGMSHSRAT